MAKVNLEKIKNIIIFFCKNTWQGNLSKTKILKLLFLCDFKHVEKYGRPITNDIYYHLPHGPIPSLIKSFLDNLNKKDDYDLGKELKSFQNTFTTEIRRTKKGNFDIITLKGDIQFNDEFFSVSELEIMKNICKKYCKTSAKELKRITHMHKGYKNTSDNEVIPYIYGIKNKADKEYFEFWEKEKQELDLILHK